jgi:opacity protein-like surface antigen
MSRRSSLSALLAQQGECVPDTSAPGASARGRGAGWALSATVALTLLAYAGVASAQKGVTSPSGVPSSPGVWTITPSLGVGEKYTDNVFGTAHDHKSDFITQFTPGLGLSYQTTPFDLLLSYTVTGEIYADNSDLDNFGDNQTGSLILGYRPDARWSFNLAGYYIRTNDPSQLLVSTAAPPGTTVVPTVETTRQETDTFTLSAGAGYQFTQRLSGRAAYGFSYLKQEGTEDSYVNTGSLGVDYKLTPLDTGSATLSGSVFEPNTDTSGTLLLGWSRQWSPAFTTSVAAGPRVTDSTWGGAANVSATYQATREWSLSLAYTLGTSLAAGTTGAQNVSALTASVGYQPLRDWQFSLDGGWTRTWEIGGSRSDSDSAYAVGASASYRITTWLGLSLSYRYTIDEPRTGDSIQTNQVLLTLTASYPWVLPR